MTFDEYGALWLSDPWIAAIALVSILGTVLWSHAWIVTGRAPRPRTMAVKMRRNSVYGVVLLNRATRPVLVRRGTANVVQLHRRRRSRTAA